MGGRLFSAFSRSTRQCRGDDQLKYALHPNSVAEPACPPSFPPVDRPPGHAVPALSGHRRPRHAVRWPAPSPGSIPSPILPPSGPARRTSRRSPTGCGSTPAARPSSPPAGDRSALPRIQLRHPASGRFIALPATGSATRHSPPAAGRPSSRPEADGFQLDATLPADLLPASQTLVIGLTVVIEPSMAARVTGRWRTAPAQPDFHPLAELCADPAPHPP